MPTGLAWLSGVMADCEFMVHRCNTWNSLRPIYLTGMSKRFHMVHDG